MNGDKTGPDSDNRPAKRTLVDRVKRAVHFFVVDIWRITENELSNSKRLSVRLAKKIIISARGFITHDLMMKAAALTFYTVMAIVPVFALVVVIARSFGIQETVDEFINETFAAQSDIIPYLTEFANNYIEHARGGVFVGVGIAVLLWSVVSAFRQIENNFNQIWNVKKSRAITRQFTTYLTILILAPVLIALASGFSIYVNQRMSSMLGEYYSAFSNFLWRLLPFVFYWLLFTLVYVLIPNTRVKFLHALLSGVVAGTGFMIFQQLYLSGQMNLTKYNSVYGTFAAIPLLLFWLQISWVIVLYGAELSYVSQNLRDYNFERETNNISRRYKDYITLLVLKIIVSRFEAKEPAISAIEISERYNIPIRLVNDILKLLSETALVVEQNGDSKTDSAYLPAFDINQITVGMLFDGVAKLGSENFIVDPENEYPELRKMVDNIQEAWAGVAQSTLIKDL